ncbi:type II toxin-antitoxin system RelE/ParE family toxin [Halomonas sp. HK25]|uniref:type II toxin-antitoxin system RelE/ParE family toxin n=1 Tax=Halomonas sp. HK25 TaxID=3394321 RepID=UPI0039FCC9D3
MSWQIEFYAGVEDDILAMPPKIQARMLRLLEMVEQHGANLGPPHTEAMGDGLFEIRAKAKEGIGRSLFCYREGRHIVILYAFVKKSQKTPRQALELARIRQREVQQR